MKPKSLVVAGHQRLDHYRRLFQVVCLWILAANMFLLLAHTARQANRVEFWRALAFWQDQATVLQGGLTLVVILSKCIIITKGPKS